MNHKTQLNPHYVHAAGLSRKAFLATLAALSLAGAAQAQQITFGGLTWDTVQCEHRDHPGVFNVFTATGSDSATIRGVYAGDSVMTTTLPALTAGSTVSYDFYLSNNGNNIPDFNGGNWFGDLGFVFQTTPTVPNFQNWTTDRTISAWNNRNEVGIGGNVINDGTELLTGGVHAVWTFNAGDYNVTLTSLVNGATTTSFTSGYQVGTSLADVHAMRVGLWDSEQTLTIDNFNVTVVPEPGSLSLLGLGAMGLAWARRRS
jgi:hypothetical protein